MTGVKQIDREQLRKEGFPEPVLLSEELIKSFSEEQKNILTTLANLAEEEKKLVDKINSMRPTPDGVLVLPGPALTVCEDEDDWRVITMKERLELKGVREKIATNLNKALDSGLGYLGLIQRQCANYGVTP